MDSLDFAALYEDVSASALIDVAVTEIVDSFADELARLCGRTGFDVIASKVFAFHYGGLSGGGWVGLPPTLPGLPSIGYWSLFTGHNPDVAACALGCHRTTYTMS